MATGASVKTNVQPNHAVFMLLVPDKAGRSISVLPSSLDALAVIDLSRTGLSGEEAGRVANLLGVSDKEMARLLNQSVATFHRQAKVDRLDSVTTERLLLLAKLASYGITVFQDSGKFTRWLQRPLRILGDRPPIDILDTTTGIQLVEDILGRIEYGVFS